MPFPVMVLMSLIVVLFIVFGVLIKYKKCYWLISGYNLMSKDKKENVDIVGLSKFMGNFCFVMAGVLLTGTILNYFEMFAGFAISLGSIFFIVSYMLIRAQKYDTNSKRPDGRLKPGVIAAIAVIIGLLMLVFAVAVGTTIYGGMENKVTLSNGYIIIGGNYGMNLEMSKISEISLVENIPGVKRKMNGYDFGNILKGNFELDKIGSAKLYISRGTAPYIYIKYEDSPVIINFKDSVKTQNLYNDIISQLKK